MTGVALNTVPDPYSEFGLFVQGQPAGYANSTQTRAFQWQNNTMTDIGTLGGPDAWGAFINRRGQIAGNSYTNDTPNHDTGFPDDYPFLWTPGRDGKQGTMRDLGTLGGDSITTDEGLNDRGEVIGSMYLAGDTQQHPYLWNGHKLKDLGTFGGLNGDTGSINDAGEVVGWAATTKSGDCESFTQQELSFFWKDDVMRKIGLLPGTADSNALAINSKTQVVGWSFNCDPPYNISAYLWERGVTTDLNTLIPPSSSLHLFFAIDINDRGEIAGFGTLSNGDVHAFVLIPNGRHASDSKLLTARTAEAPRKVTTAELAVYRAILAHLRNSRMRHRRL